MAAVSWLLEYCCEDELPSRQPYLAREGFLTRDPWLARRFDTWGDAVVAKAKSQFCGQLSVVPRDFPANRITPMNTAWMIEFPYRPKHSDPDARFYFGEDGFCTSDLAKARWFHTASEAEEFRAGSVSLRGCRVAERCIDDPPQPEKRRVQT